MGVPRWAECGLTSKSVSVQGKCVRVTVCGDRESVGRTREGEATDVFEGRCEEGGPRAWNQMFDESARTRRAIPQGRDRAGRASERVALDELTATGSESKRADGSGNGRPARGLAPSCLDVATRGSGVQGSMGMSVVEPAREWRGRCSTAMRLFAAFSISLFPRDG